MDGGYEIQFTPGGITVNAAAIDRLHYLHLRAKQRAEQAEADEHECCRIFGLDPDDGTSASDEAKRVVTDSTTPETVIAMVRAALLREGRL